MFKKTMHPAVEVALIFLALTVLMAVADCHAQTTWVECQYIPTGAIQSFPDYCPQDWVRI